MTQELTEETADRTARVGREVKVWLVRLGWTQARLAEVLGLAQQNVSQRLNGRRPFNVEELFTIADAMGLTLGELMGPGLVNEKTPRPMGEGSDEGSGGGARSRDLTIMSRAL